MTPNEYQELAGRTCPQEYDKLEGIKPYKQHMLHAHLGLSSEVGEIGDALKKHFVYGQALDYTNIVEECGDILWYISLMLDSWFTGEPACRGAARRRCRLARSTRRYPEQLWW